MPRLVGIEMEFVGSQRAAVDALRAAGLDCNHTSSHVGWSQHEWTVKHDGSVSSGGECVSPPLDFDSEEQRAQVDTAVAALRASGAQSHPSAGIHVHVDASDLDAEQVAAVCRVFVKFEDLIYRIAASGWREIRGGEGGWSFCKPLPQEMIDRLPRVRTRDQLRTAHEAGLYGGDRYRGVNLSIWFDAARIEFRVFNSSLNAERIQAYIALCVALVEDARRGNKRSINKAYRLGQMRRIRDEEGEEALKRHEKNAFHRLLQVLRYEAGLSKEDMNRLGKVWKDSVAQPAFSPY